MNDEEFKAMVKQGIARTIKQGRPALDEKGDCKYCTESGDRCVVGHMMTDEELSEFGSRTGTVDDLVVSGFRTSLDSDQIETLIMVQDCHDGNAEQPVEDFVSEFKDALNYSPVYGFNLKEILKEIEDEQA